MTDMHAAADDASALLKALSNPHRLLIACKIYEHEQTVGNLAKSLQMRDSTVSQHLAILRRDKFVSARREGHLVWYSITNDAAWAVIETLHLIYCRPPAHRRAKAGKTPKPKRAR